MCNRRLHFTTLIAVTSSYSFVCLYRYYRKLNRACKGSNSLHFQMCISIDLAYAYRANFSVLCLVYGVFWHKRIQYSLRQWATPNPRWGLENCQVLGADCSVKWAGFSLVAHEYMLRLAPASPLDRQPTPEAISNFDVDHMDQVGYV